MPSQKPGEPNDTSSPSKLAAGLYIVATPLGNLGDITARAMKVLGGVDLLACEDTRVTGRLFQALGLKPPPLVRYDDHASERTRERLIAAMQAGQAVGLASDAGTPLIADPGYKLVRAVHKAGFKVYSVPGPSAVIAALSISGLPTDRFLCAGFLPAKATARRKTLQSLVDVPATLVFFEAPHRLAESLADMAAVLGEREAVIARELTKLFEETRRGRLGPLAAHYAEAGEPKGEIVVVVGPPEADQASAEERAADLDARLEAALASASLRDAADAVAAATGLPRRQVYARALTLTKDRT